MDKTCSQCARLLPLAAFHRWNRGKHGRMAACKACRLGRPVPLVLDGQKYCPGCHLVLPLEAYAKSADRKCGVQSRCRECRGVVQADYAARNADKLREKGRRYSKEHPEVNRAWVVANRARVAATHAEYRARHPDKAAARSAVSNAVARGLLTKDAACSTCETVGYVEARHDDYSRPLDVRWLCKTCHEMVHHAAAP